MKFKTLNKICITFSCIAFLNTNAQTTKQSGFTCKYNYQIPIGNLATTFGNSSAVGGSYFVELKNNILLGIEGDYIFGTTIKDLNIFENISTSNGAIINSNGYYANINLMQRGLSSHFFAGYAFHMSTKNLSGIYLSQSIGYLQHKIFIDTQNQNIPQLNEEMKKGYDRFSNGISTKSALDYKYYSKNGKFQISIGINYTIAQTKNRRDYDFANNEFYSKKNNWDQILGLKTAVIIPFNKRNQEEFHYY